MDRSTGGRDLWNSRRPGHALRGRANLPHAIEERPDAHFSANATKVAFDSGNYHVDPEGRPTRGGQGELTFWSLKSGRRLLALQHPGYIRALTFSPDGNRLLAAISRRPGTPFKPIQI